VKFFCNILDFRGKAASLFDRVVEGDSSIFQSKFTGSDQVKEYLIGNMEKMKALSKINPQIKMRIEFQLFYVKKAFLANVSKDSQYCSCKDLNAARIFPGMFDVVNKECDRLCGNNALEFDSEFEEE
jgi:hypothetical protein